MVKNVKSWLYVLIPFCAVSLVYLGGVGIYGVVTLDDVPVSWLGTPSNDVFVMTVSGQGYVVDITNGNTTLMYTTFDELRNMRQTEVEACVLTHLHRRHAYSLARLCARRMVQRSYSGAFGRRRDGYAEDIRAVADEYGAEVMFFPRPSDAEIDIDGVRLTLFGTSYIKRSVHPLIGLRFGIGDAELLYGGRGALGEPGFRRYKVGYRDLRLARTEDKDSSGWLFRKGVHALAGAFGNERRYDARRDAAMNFRRQSG
ncbi:MAG: hypothetical protein V8R90_01195 [Eubacterium sp.]